MPRRESLRIHRRAAAVDPIRRYCPFCKTPCRASRTDRSAAWCVECHSPLPASGAEEAAGTPASRDALRLARIHEVRLYVYWPSRAEPGQVCDLSATGARITTRAALAPGLTVKLESDAFSALARVVRAREIGNGHEIGLTFLSARFARRGGNFVSVRV